MQKKLLKALTIPALLLVGALPAGGFSTVVIDPGHGGHDRGGIPGQRVSEKVLALDVAKRLEKILRGAGYRTVMTRRNDVFISLADRVRIANAQRDAIFVSVHFNSASNRDATGIETYYFSPQGARLASNIQSNLIRACRTDNRGVKRRGFYVIRHARHPAVLVECGFLTNPSEARRCLNSNYRQTLAMQIARGIAATKASSRHQPLAKPLARKPPPSSSSPLVEGPRVVINSSSTPSPGAQAPSSIEHLSDRELRALFLENRR